MESRLTNHSSGCLTATADLSRSRIAARSENNPLELTGLRPTAQRGRFIFVKKMFLHSVRCHVNMTLYRGHMTYNIDRMTLMEVFTNAGANSWLSQ